VQVLCGILLIVVLSDYRQNVVIVGAGRFSRSAKFATSSELLYLLNLLYNMPSECCVEYKLIRLYQKSSVWCFAFSHASTFELIPQLPRLCRELGNTSSYVPNLNFLPQFVSERAGGSKSGGGAGPGGWRSR